MIDLEQLKLVLTNTVTNVEPDADAANQMKYAKDFLRHYIQGKAYTMLPKVRLDNIQYCLSEIEYKNVPGDLIETGVWRGGATIFMRAWLKKYAITDRNVWVADSFEGLPKPDAEMFPKEAESYDYPLMEVGYKRFAVSLEEVQGNFNNFGMLDDQVKFLKGWFKDTLPVAPIEKLALMRLDGDYYDSTMDALVNLYPKLSVGGYVIIDDFGESIWTNCYNAVMDFRNRNGIFDTIKGVDSKCCYWKKTGVCFL